MKSIENISLLADEINGAQQIVLVGHVNPDGDAIGSLMGMKGYLETMGN